MKKDNFLQGAFIATLAIVVAKVLGIIYLKDIVKRGVKEKFSDLRRPSQLKFCGIFSL